MGVAPPCPIVLPTRSTRGSTVPAIPAWTRWTILVSTPEPIRASILESGTPATIYATPIPASIRVTNPATTPAVSVTTPDMIRGTRVMSRILVRVTTEIGGRVVCPHLHHLPQHRRRADRGVGSLRCWPAWLPSYSSVFWPTG